MDQRGCTSNAFILKYRDQRLERVFCDANPCVRVDGNLTGEVCSGSVVSSVLPASALEPEKPEA